MKARRAILALPLIALLLGGCRPTIDPEAWEALPWNPTEVRVRLAGERELLLVAFPDGGGLNTPEGERLYRVPAGWELVFSREGDGLAVNGQALPGGAVVLRPGGASVADPRLSFDHADYRGEFIVDLDGSGLLLVNRLDVEEYLRGVLPAETYASWPAAALEAQAVVSRSYALARAWSRPMDTWQLRADTGDQVYRGRDVEDPRTDAALTTTAGRVAVYDDELITAYFSSCCGGRTVPAEEAWPGSAPVPYLGGVDCPWCVDCPNHEWELRLEFDQLSAALAEAGYTNAPLCGLRPSTSTRSGRVTAVEFTNTAGESFSLGGEELRRVVGYSRLKSTRFAIASSDAAGLNLRGGGYGHGVGLCQWGARGMAEAGYELEEIIDFYYPGAEVRDYRSLEPPTS